MRLWPSAFVAALFALHPLRVESVAWIAERKDVLSGLFFMLTLWAYLGYVHHPFSLPRYLSVIVLFALGLMSKPMLVTLPFVLLLLDYWPLGAFPRRKPLAVSQTTWRRLIAEKIPLFLLAAASCVVTIWAQQAVVVPLDELLACCRDLARHWSPTRPIWASSSIRPAWRCSILTPETACPPGNRPPR